MNTRNFLLTLAVMFSTASAFGAYQIGEVVKDDCWIDHQDKKVCLDDHKDKVRVLIYNAGWCGPCNTEMRQLAPKVKEFDNKPVAFFSLSLAGWSQNSYPDRTFLNSWRNQYQIPFTVAADPRDPGRDYLPAPYYIPGVAIIDQNGKLAYTNNRSSSADGIIREVRRLLGTDVTRPTVK